MDHFWGGREETVNEMLSCIAQHKKFADFLKYIVSSVFIMSQKRFPRKFSNRRAKLHLWFTRMAYTGIFVEQSITWWQSEKIDATFYSSISQKLRQFCIESNLSRKFTKLQDRIRGANENFTHRKMLKANVKLNSTVQNVRWSWEKTSWIVLVFLYSGDSNPQ